MLLPSTIAPSWSETDRPDQCLETLSDMGFAGAYRLKSLAASGQKVGFKVYFDEIDRVLASGR